MPQARALSAATTVGERHITGKTGALNLSLCVQVLGRSLERAKFRNIRNHADKSRRPFAMWSIRIINNFDCLIAQLKIEGHCLAGYGSVHIGLRARKNIWSKNVFGMFADNVKRLTSIERRISPIDEPVFQFFAPSHDMGNGSRCMIGKYLQFCLRSSEPKN